jgi:hypothetical protein
MWLRCGVYTDAEAGRGEGEGLGMEIQFRREKLKRSVEALRREVAEPRR